MVPEGVWVLILTTCEFYLIWEKGLFRRDSVQALEAERGFWVICCGREGHGIQDASRFEPRAWTVEEALQGATRSRKSQGTRFPLEPPGGTSPASPMEMTA